MVARALWKGHLKIDQLTCAVALYAAASTAERVSFHTVNRKTGHRVHREYIDPDTGKMIVPGTAESNGTLGTTPQSHMCVRNYTSHALFMYKWIKLGKAGVIVIE